MKLNFDKKFKDLSGKEVTSQGTLGQFLANALSGENKGDPIKIYGWALKLYAGETIDLDKSDQAKLKAIIESSESMTVMAKAQLLEVFESPAGK